MSDDQLFKNADAQEAAYAPEGSEEDISDQDTVAGAGVIVPAAGFATVGSGVGGMGGPAGTPAVGPAVAGAALAGDLAPDTRPDSERDGAAGVNDADGQTSSG